MTPDVVTSARPIAELLTSIDPFFGDLPDADLMSIVQTRLGFLIARMCLREMIPRADWHDGAEAYKQIYMRLWLELYGRTLYRYGSHDAAVYMCAHLGVLNELGIQAFRKVEKMLRWQELPVVLLPARKSERKAA